MVGTILVLSGLADVTNFCLNNQPLGVGAGIKLQPVSPPRTPRPSPACHPRSGRERRAHAF